MTADRAPAARIDGEHVVRRPPVLTDGASLNKKIPERIYDLT
ncbi:hypothetical protein [Streptomyces sp. NRRL F-5123]|nr:hypothetical protein [Streptomyces sp. NRRL F-5123]